jgi:hypothetical protein
MIRRRIIPDAMNRLPPRWLGKLIESFGVSYMRTKFAFLGSIPLAMAAAACSHQAEATDGAQWAAVQRSDLAGTPDLALRDPATLNLRADGDFNGDGRADSATIRQDRGAARYGVLVCLSRPTGACAETLVASGPAAHLRTLGIKTVPAASAATAMAGVKARMASAARLGKQDLLEVFAFEASSSVFSWTGSGFEETQITD